MQPIRAFSGWAILLAIVAGIGAEPAGAQVVPRRPGVNPVQRNPRAMTRRVEGEEDLAADGVFVPPDRTAKRRLEMAEQMLGEKRYGEAVRMLGALLENPEDYFFKPNPEQPVFRSLKAEAGGRVAALPAEGRESYELQFGARARQMLSAATSNGSLAARADVSRLFFYPQAGQEATFLVARAHLDQNRPLAAALCLERLRSMPDAVARFEPALSLTLATSWRRADKADKAKETLVRLKRSLDGKKVILAGKSVKLFSDDAQALAWFDSAFGAEPIAHATQLGQWPLYRGNESRNGSSAGSRPLLSPRWRQRTTDDRVIERFVSKSRHDYVSQELVALPAMHPLAIDDVIIMRTAFAIQAVDFQTGKLVWRYAATDDSFEQFLKLGSAQQPTSGTQQLVAGLEQRIWEDAVYGTMSSDGKQVYFLEGLGLAGVNANLLMTVMPNGQRRYTANARGTNRLVARELRTQGKLKWEIGGVTGEDEPKLAGTFFLGPPLPLMGRLWAVAEMKGQEVRLLVLSPETGALEWSQQLAVVEQPVTADGFRRNAGAVPSFADGVLVCPTSAGAVVGVDLTTRSLLWGYQYPRAQQFASERFINGRLAVYPGSGRRDAERWADASATVADGHVLLTPVESDHIYCLNLTDGRELWKQNRGSMLYVACVHGDKAVLVGRNSVSAIKLSTGEKAWPADLEFPATALPSGRGFASGDFYYVPLSTAEVLKINLRTGLLEEQSRSRRGVVPGNLIAYRGSIVSQSADYVDAFSQLDALRTQIAETLAAHPDDWKALAGLAEVKLDEQKLAESVELFSRSYNLKPDERTREQLVETLLESLRTDFAANRASLAELENLVKEPKHRVEFLRLKAAGLQASGEVLPAFETYMKLTDMPGGSTLETIEDRLVVRRDRWIRAQLDDLFEKAGDARPQLETVCQERLEKAISADTPEALRSYLAVFGSSQSGQKAREALYARLSADDLLERNLLLRNLERSSDAAQAGRATAQLAKMLREAGRTELAGPYYRQLATRFADVECEPGKKGAQLVSELSRNDPLRKYVAASAPWPRGRVDIKQESPGPRTPGSPMRIQTTLNLEIVGPVNPLFEDVSIAYDAQQYLVAQDGLGERRFRIPLFEQGGRRAPNVNRNAYNAPALSYAGVNGGLMVLLLGNQVLAVDTMRLGETASNRVLWTEELNDNPGGYPTSQGVLTRPVNLAWGGVRFVPEDAFGRRLGSMGPVNDDGLAFQRLHDLTCVDPLTGKPIWTRRNVGLGNDLFGDEKLLFVAPPGDSDCLVLDAATGQQVGTRRVAPLERRVVTIGRSVLSWEPQNQLAMRDAWAGSTLWTHPFAPGSKAALVGHEAVGILQPDGGFTLLALPDGKPLVQQKLEAEAALASIFLMRTSEGYLLITNGAARGEPHVALQPIPAAPNNIVSGRMYAFDRETGKPLWPKPVPLSQQGLLLSQPRSLPALVFARQLHTVSPVNQREAKMSVMCIDKRSGRVLYKNDDLPGSTIASFEIAGDPVAHTVTVSLPAQSIKLSFTDEPLAPRNEGGSAEGKAAAAAEKESTEKAK